MRQGSNYVWGLFLGAACIFALLFFLAMAMRKKRGMPARGRYDERQQYARGKAFRTAFFVLLGYNTVYGLFEMATGIRWCENTFTGLFIGIVLAATAFAMQAIFSDAYLSVSEKPRQATAVFSVVAAANLLAGIWNLLAPDTVMVQDGMLTFHAINLIVAGMCILILAALGVKRAMDRAAEKAEGR